MGRRNSARHFSACTIVSCSTFPQGSTYRFVSPLHGDGQPVDPQDLPEFLETREWDGPSCLCAIRDLPRKAQFLVPSWRDSPAYGMMCLVCPDAKCCYFGTFTHRPTSVNCFNLTTGTVNVTELFNNHRDSLLSVGEVVSTEQGSSPSDGGQYI